VFDVVIVGGGIVGAACALECTRNGMKVAVIEDQAIGGGATAAAMGHVVVMSDSEAQFALTRYSQQLWNQLAKQLPPDCEYVERGTLWVAADEEEMAEVRRMNAYYSERSVPVQVLDSQALAGAEPNLRQAMAGALLVQGDGITDPPCVTRYLIGQAQARGAALFLGRRVVKMDDSGVVIEDGTRVSGSAMVNAAGSRASQLTPGLPVVPRKGHLAITDSYPAFIHHQIVELGYLKSAHKATGDSVAFNIQPRRTGQLLIGSSRQYGVDTSSVDVSVLNRMLARAVEYMPGLQELSIARTWTGLRGATPDKLPLIGKCQGFDRVYAAAGHEGLGITTSLATARLLVDELLNRSSEIPREPYSPRRAIVTDGDAEP
jgi:glycine/D-amino acid oxidase-like deaminating enzyme